LFWSAAWDGLRGRAQGARSAAIAVSAGAGLVQRRRRMRSARRDCDRVRALRILVADANVVSPAFRCSGLNGHRRGRSFLDSAARPVNPFPTPRRSSAEGDNMVKRELSLMFICLLIPAALFASSHREAPLISEDPAADGTDVYVFRSPDAPNTVTFVANYYPFLPGQA